MYSGRRNTHQFRFKNPELKELRKLGSLVGFPSDFKDRYGRLLTVLNTDVEDVVLNTLVQFYDSMYRGFAFSDYQFAPNLEEYSYYIGLPVSDQKPFNGLYEIHKSRVIGEAMHLRKGEIDANLVTKGGILRLPAKFLMEKDATLSSVGSMVTFEDALAFVIYGIILFPNVDNFVDTNAISIFLIRNPLPSLLADTYYFIHHRTEKNGVIVMCCAPLLYKWFISHLS
ncbi:uncharacterized protein LOC127137358 [Lathyrus oleraceus]|uniref:uncharacterized protein LOC127137358 n=1 Tax=Pisum sativum TaxID=3888 RepID=UPI0021D3368E|nr:uncharacterized protein LOC127137358 [Pisum sativum]